LRRSRSAFGPTLNELHGAWLRFGEEPAFFNEIRIARDGGFSDVPELFTPLRYVWSVGTLIGIGVNFWSLCRVDIAAVRHSSWLKDTQAFLFTDWIIDHIVYWETYRIEGGHVVALLDLALVLLLMMRGVLCLGKVACLLRKAPLSSEEAMYLWHAVAQFFWGIVPQFATISAMMFLYFVTPVVLMPDLAHRVGKLMDPNSRRPAWPFLKFLFSRAFYLIIGFDSFLVKFRTAARYAIDRDMTTFEAILGSFAFLNQVLGVVQVRWFVQRRLMLFFFGGEDAYMNEERQIRKMTWNAMLARCLWEKLTFMKFLAVMLSFSDYDFQKLALVEFAGMPTEIGVTANESDIERASFAAWSDRRIIRAETT